MRNASPLRYPGGKWRLQPFFERLICLNFRQPPIYVEPYAGGASLALSLLFSGTVSEIFLNDLDPAIFAFWRAVLTRSTALIQLVETTPVTPAEWHVQKAIYSRGSNAGSVPLAFATFFLNRTNHSGIMNGGMIGGKKQAGTWKLDARFNRSELISRIAKVASYRSRIHICNRDAVDFIGEYARTAQQLIYLDPPYYYAGRHLYMNSYDDEDHVQVRRSVRNLNCRWVVSYDDVSPIRRLYRNQRSRHVELIHTARTARTGREVMFFSATLKLPRV